MEHNRLCNNPNESKMLMNEQFNSLNRELLAANEERIAKDQEIEYWKQKYTVIIFLFREHLRKMNLLPYKAILAASRLRQKILK